MIETLLWIVFVLACLIVSAVVLLQEGKGGGLGEAFGGVGQQTFGVKAEGINMFTGWVSLLVVVLAIVITKYRSEGSSLAFPESAPAPLSTPNADGSAPPSNGTAPGTGEPGTGDQTGTAPPAQGGEPAPAGDGAPAPAPSGDSAPAPAGDGGKPADGEGK
ncbi:MAG TPA: preprotein translocase subunit SecG [Planctomycetota bacterium]|nr:preprotein translocase subunit SecG [Planctomycetota bacterium]